MRNANRGRTRISGAVDNQPSGVCPISLGNLQLWFDAMTIKNLADSVAVPQWNDLSGNNRNLTQGTGVSQPLFKANGLNGLPCLRFDGLNDYMTGSAFVCTNMTLFMVFKPGNLITNNLGIMSFYKTGASDWNNEDCWNFSGTVTDWNFEFVRYLGANPLSLSPVSNGHTPIVITLQLKNATTTAIARVNGVETTDTYSDANPIDSTTMIIGARYDTSVSTYGRNDYSEIIAYNDVKDAGTILAIEQYLTNKWRISS